MKSIEELKKSKIIWGAGIVVLVAVIVVLCLVNAPKNYTMSKGALEKYCKQSGGSVMADIDYVDDHKVVFHYLNGFFVYDRTSNTISHSMDLSKLDVAPQQEDSYKLGVTVDGKGQYAYLYSYGSQKKVKKDKKYRVDLKSGEITKQEMPQEMMPFHAYQNTKETIKTTNKWFSDRCVVIGDDVYYLVMKHPKEVGSLCLEVKTAAGKTTEIELLKGCY